MNDPSPKTIPDRMLSVQRAMTPGRALRDLQSPRMELDGGATPGRAAPCNKSKRVLNEVRMADLLPVASSPITAGKVRRRRSGGENGDNGRSFRSFIKEVKCKITAPISQGGMFSDRVGSTGWDISSAELLMDMQPMKRDDQPLTLSSKTPVPLSTFPSMCLEGGNILTLSPAFLKTASALSADPASTEELERQLEELDQEDEALKSLHSGLDRALALICNRCPPPLDSEAEIVELRAQLTKQAKRMSDIVSRHASEKLEAEAAALEAACKRDALADQCEGAEAEVERLSQHRETLDLEASSLRASLAAAQRAQAASEGEAERLRHEAEAAWAQCERYHEAGVAANSEAAKLQEHVSELMGICGDLREKLRSATAKAGEECERLSGEVEAVSAERALLRLGVEEAAARKVEAEEENAR